MKRLITLISTKGKTPQEVSQELFQNLKKYHQAEKYSNMVDETEKNLGVVIQIIGYPHPQKMKNL